ncbi:MAG TPA: thioredoxin family protein, partial [Membranihabitans sp.]|nr:thioredoxin family protein [Membranihabitans sp.]
MKTVYSTFIFLFCVSLANSQIEFKDGTWDELLQFAQAENKPIFVDAYAVWCGPCKRMASEVFTQSGVGDFFNGNFV